jgi:hypothetical protein
VADRFHLVKNVGAALDAVVRSRRRQVEIEQAQADAEPPTVQPTAPPRPPGPTRQRQLAARARRVGRWEAARALRAEGQSLSAIARELGLNRKTVRQLVRTPEPPRNRPRPPRPPRATGLRSPSLQPFLPYLEARWRDGCHVVSQLQRELEAQGCRTSRSLLAEALRPWRSPEERTRRGSPQPKRRRRQRISAR